MKDPRLWTAIVDFVVSVAAICIGIWVVPEYIEAAIGLVAAFQGLTAVLIVVLTGQEIKREIRASENRLRGP